VSQLIGNAFGGVLYVAFSAPRLILINGLSFLIASVTQLFMKIPAVRRASEKKRILHDMADGVKYTFGNRGLRSLLIMCLVTNFFAMIGLTLMTPLFKNTPGFGVERYGFVMGCMMAGAVIGMVALSILKIKPARRARVFGTALVVEVFVIIPIGFVMNVNVLYPLAFVAGICNALVNMMIQTIMQATTPSENRGKVFGIMGTASGALMPLAMAASGFIAAFAGVRPTIVGSFVAVMIGGVPLLVNRHFREFINTDISQPAAADAVEIPAALPAED
jgi:DHA3 family macrolide efflux protein-like MFS transporter